ncbi:MAG: hypothetical protein HY722_06735 [Planctomycetes bacterium]|nr:hypothetical protein [Planctomycetota bacterium]
MTGTSMASPYRAYWVAWGVLLAMTLVMVSLATPALLLAGILTKAAIITLFFMHLRHERLDFALGVALATVLTGLVLFGLIAVDAV